MWKRSVCGSTRKIGKNKGKSGKNTRGKIHRVHNITPFLRVFCPRIYYKSIVERKLSREEKRDGKTSKTRERDREKRKTCTWKGNSKILASGQFLDFELGSTGPKMSSMLLDGLYMSSRTRSQLPSPMAGSSIPE